MLHNRIAEARSRSRAEIHHAARHSGLFQHLNELRGNRRRIARRLQDHRVPGHDRSRRHPRHDGEREIPRRNHRAHAQRNIDQFIRLPRQLDRRLRLRQPQRLAAVELEKVDRLAHVGIGLGPVLAHFVRKPCAELEIALPDNLRRSQQQRSPRLNRSPAPRLKRLQARLAWPVRRARRRPSDERRPPAPAAPDSATGSCPPCCRRWPPMIRSYSRPSCPATRSSAAFILRAFSGVLKSVNGSFAKLALGRARLNFGRESNSCHSESIVFLG